MWQALIEDNFGGAKSLDSEEVEDAFEMIEYLRKYRKMEKLVVFPLYEMAEIDGMYISSGRSPLRSTLKKAVLSL